jgi:hypothetical protein
VEKCGPESQELSTELVNEYKQIIRKTLHYFYIPDLYKEDLEVDLLYVLFKADKDFNGAGSIHGYRKTMMGYYIKNFLRKLKRENEIKKVQIHENIQAKDIKDFDYLSYEEKRLLLDKYVYKNPMSSFSKNEKKSLELALEKVKYNENNS